MRSGAIKGGGDSLKVEVQGGKLGGGELKFKIGGRPEEMGYRKMTNGSKKWHVIKEGVKTNRQRMEKGKLMKYQNTEIL